MNVMIGVLGSVLDLPSKSWRPSVALTLHPGFPVGRYYLLYQPAFRKLLESTVADIRAASPHTEIIPCEIPLRDPWDFEEVYASLYDFARSMVFEPEREDYYIHITTGTHVMQICLFLLTESHHFPGRLFQTSPARRSKAPEGIYAIIDLDLSQYSRLATRFEAERRDDLAFLKQGIATRNPGFNALIETIERVAVRTTAPILLTGPTGAGKSQLARKIYELKRQNHQLSGAFVELNCATLRGEHAISTLFGHTKGAFTGASQARQGLLKEAEGGILFLDEIGELGLDEQAMLLRAVEDGIFYPLGSDQAVHSTFQLICGTNRVLEEAVRTGRFREDLLARVNLWTFELPGLAQRREDIEPNLDYELERYAEKNGYRVQFTRDARADFLAFAKDPATLWRGNFRDFNAAVTRMATLASGALIDAKNVQAEITRLRGGAENRSAGDDLAALLGAEYAARYDRFDLAQLAEVVRVCRESRSLSEAGRKLFAVSRQARASINDSDRLRKFLARFELSWEAVHAFGRFQ